MSFAITAVERDLYQIALPHPALPSPYNAPTNVYLLTGEHPALVGTGHPGAQAGLAAALATVGLRLEDITRVVATDWTPDQLGGAAAFENADLFAFSPDMVEPSDYGALVTAGRRQLAVRGEALLSVERFSEAMGREELETALTGYWSDALPRRISPIPLRDGHTLALGERSFRVLKASGPTAGHMALLQDGALLFAGRLVTDTRFGDMWLEDASQTMLTVEQLYDADVEALLPTVGPVEYDVAWTMRRLNRNMTNVLSNLPAVLRQANTVPEIIWRDLGYVPSHPVRFLHTARTYQAYFDELIRTGVVFREGDGLLASYSTETVEERLSRL